MTGLFRWVRTNSEKYLLESVQADLARKYLGRPPTVGPRNPQVIFWKYMFVPLYRRLPWKVKHSIILAMPGSHRHGWDAQGRGR
jgi:hypothetical protein